MKPHIVILDHFALFLYIRPDTQVKFYGCTNCIKIHNGSQD